MHSAIIYNGPSLIDGKPIVVIANGKKKSRPNEKTGDMVQTYIIRSDIDPRDASKTGEDFSICGDCIHRGTPTESGKLAAGRSCYVNISQGVLQTYKAMLRGNYPMATAEQAAEIGNGRMVRLGTYGDPAAVPQSVWDSLLSKSAGHTGYTHNGASTDICMVSADSLSQAARAWADGLRTFRVIKIADWKEHGKAALATNEILCPASEEAGRRVQCNDCKLCSGSLLHAKSIAIVSHGAGKNNFQ